MSDRIDIEGIFRRNRIAVDGHVNCSIEDWNNIVKYIADLEERESNIKADVIREFSDYVQDRADAWWIEDIADDFIKELERGEL